MFWKKDAPGLEVSCVFGPLSSKDSTACLLLVTPPYPWLQPSSSLRSGEPIYCFTCWVFVCRGSPLTKKRPPKTSNDQDGENPVSPCDGSFCFIIPTFLTAWMFSVLDPHVVQGSLVLRMSNWKQSGSARYSILLNSPSNPLRQLL